METKPPLSDTLSGLQDVPAENVISAMCEHACEYSQRLAVGKVIVLAVMGGAFITVGALFSILLSIGIQTPPLRFLLEGFGFSAGFFFVILSRCVLFTEANVLLPTSFLNCDHKHSLFAIIRFWLIAWAGNWLGAWIISLLIHAAHFYNDSVSDTLQNIINLKLQYRNVGGVTSWCKIIISGILANWLVGMASFFATMSQRISGKYISVFLAVSIFVAANFQHSPANMGYFSLYIASHDTLSWWTALGWNIIPAGIGNVIGGALFVALPFWFAFRKTSSSTTNK